MSSIGARLREERERLGVNQTAFASMGGVLKGAQVNYEAGKRSPDAAYLSALAECGVDVLYVLTGRRIGGVPQGPALRDGEATLLEGYRSLDARGRMGVQALISGLAPHSHGPVNVQVSGHGSHVVTGSGSVVVAPPGARRKPLPQNGGQ